jgi:hypothetical protein
MFDQSNGAPLEFSEGVELSFAHFREARMRSIEYTNPDGDRVTGVIAHPSGEPTDVGVLVLPGLPESASQMLEPLALLSCAGVTALAIDAPYVRAGRMAEPLTFDETDAREQIQFIIETRRAIDVLEVLGATRFGVHATSWGTSIGAMLSGVEDRVEAYALMIGNGGLIDRFMPEGELLAPLAGVPEEQRDRWVEAMAPLEATLYIGDSNADILFQDGREDPFVTQQTAEKLHNAAPDTAEVIWYDVGHTVSPRMIADNFSWLADQLGLDGNRIRECIELMPSS